MLAQTLPDPFSSLWAAAQQQQQQVLTSCKSQCCTAQAIPLSQELASPALLFFRILSTELILHIYQGTIIC